MSALPAYRTGVSPLLRGVEIGLAHGFFLPGPFIKLGPLRNTPKAEIAGTLSGMGVVAILAACLAMYGAVSFQEEEPLGRKTLTGREVSKDPLQSEEGWQRFTAGFTFGGFSGALFCYSMLLSYMFSFFPTFLKVMVLLTGMRLLLLHCSSDLPSSILPVRQDTQSSKHSLAFRLCASCAQSSISATVKERQFAINVG